MHSLWLKKHENPTHDALLSSPHNLVQSMAVSVTVVYSSRFHPFISELIDISTTNHANKSAKTLIRLHFYLTGPFKYPKTVVIC
ncbi:hypothetical protein GDO81_002931 [Engystomops pustulosus]|uniref:Uncharacterized protein n=1 Tax=Engystomops pustulosus TaxID=76066 RepID=A0AAV7DTC7_ENGPU|nr:hypothetical protein GDO81_002931 [Engystomops pustulosus]